MSSTPTYVLPPFRTTFSLSDVTHLHNHVGVLCCAPDPSQQSNDLRYLVKSTVQNAFQSPEINDSTGHIAKLVGKPTYSRHVGQGQYSRPNLIVLRGLTHPQYNPALKWLSPDIDPPVPWHRVIASSGTISSRGPGTDGAQRQRDALETEGVEVTDGRTGEMRVDLRTYGWFPNALEGLGGDGGDADV